MLCYKQSDRIEAMCLPSINQQCLVAFCQIHGLSGPMRCVYTLYFANDFIPMVMSRDMFGQISPYCLLKASLCLLVSTKLDDPFHALIFLYNTFTIVCRTDDRDLLTAYIINKTLSVSCGRCFEWCSCFWVIFKFAMISLYIHAYQATKWWGWAWVNRGCILLLIPRAQQTTTAIWVTSDFIHENNSLA